MGISDIPQSFGLSFFMRIFFPASIGTILYGIAFRPFIKKIFWFELTFENTILIWIIISLLIGILLDLLDLYIYRLYEGLKFWPNKLKKDFYDGQIKNFCNNIDGKLKEVYEEIDIKEESLKNSDDEIVKKELKEELRELHKKARRLWSEVRSYPYNSDYDTYSNRYPEYLIPTEFGNVLAEYELYSEKQYGMHMMIFWHHLWLILPKEVRNELELRGAKADFSVYISFLLLTYIFIGTIGVFV